MYYIYFFTIFLATKHVESAFDYLRLSTPEHIYSSGQIQLYMIREQIVPKIINVPPRRHCQVSFPNLEKLRPGDKLFTNITDKPPHLFWRGRNETLYTVYMIGWRKEIKHRSRIRAYWPKKLKKYLLRGKTGTKPQIIRTVDDWDQWLVVNVPNNHIRAGDTIIKYKPPPPPEDGLIPARYVFIIFEQKSRIDPTKIGERRYARNPSLSKVMDFAIENDFDPPLAANYFIVRRVHKPVGKKSTLNKRTRKVYTAPTFMPSDMKDLVKILDKRKQFQHA